MWLCKYDLSKECEGKYKDCINCILDQIRAEIEQMPSELTTDGRRMIRRVSVFRIIDNYKAGK